MHAELPTVSFICVAVLAIVLPVHFKRISTSHASILIWLLICNLIQGVDSIVWAYDTATHAPVWCDIASKISISLNIVAPAALLSVCRHLELLASSRIIELEEDSQRRRRQLESILCIGVPLVYAGLHIIVQDHRFDIVEDFGCLPSTYSSPASIVLVWIPPLIVTLIGLFYIGCIVRHFFRHQSIFFQHLESRTYLTSSYFGRLFVSSTAQLLVLFTFFVVSIVSEAITGLKSWSNIHRELSQVHVISLSDVAAIERAQIQFSWWKVPVLSLLCIAVPASGDLSHIYCVFNEWKERRRSRGVELESASWIDTSDLPKRSKYPVLVSSQAPTPILLNTDWEDTYRSDASNSDSSSSTRAKSPYRITIQEPESPTTPQDQAFAASTMYYLRSSVGQRALRSASPSLPIQENPDEERLSTSPVSAAIIKGSWPEPPSTVLTSPTLASRSRSPSPFETAAYGLHYPPHPAVCPPSSRSRPDGPRSVSPVQSTMTFPKQVRRQASLREDMSGNRFLSPHDAIRFTGSTGAV